MMDKVVFPSSDSDTAPRQHEISFVWIDGRLRCSAQIAETGRLVSASSTELDEKKVASLVTCLKRNSMINRTLTGTDGGTLNFIGPHAGRCVMLTVTGPDKTPVSVDISPESARALGQFLVRPRLDSSMVSSEAPVFGL